MMYRSGERANNSYLNTFILLLKWPLFEPKMPTVQWRITLANWIKKEDLFPSTTQCSQEIVNIVE